MIKIGAATGRSHGAGEREGFWFICTCDGGGPGFKNCLAREVGLVVVMLMLMSDLGIGFKMAG